MMEIRPINIVAAALVAQVLITITLSIGTSLLGRRDFKRIIRMNKKDDPLKMHVINFPTTIGISTILTIACLVGSDEFVTVWRPLFGSNSFSLGLQTPTAISIMFYVDIIVVAYLVWMTEGSRMSPFSPLFFVLPTLAIFLRQPFRELMLYLLLIGIFFTALMFCERLNDSRQIESSISRSYWAVSILCFVVTTTLAILTRPI